MVKPGESDLGQNKFGLPSLQPLPTAAERAADLIRENIFEGRFAPGTALPEAALANALQVSRNTVREAFRTLIGEHLLAHEPHKGVIVRRLAVSDVRDIYKLRRMFELAALEDAVVGALNLAELDNKVTQAERASEEGRWADVGTANLRFHAEIVSAHQSGRINEIFRRLMTEMRLGFLAFSEQMVLHGPFIPRNRMLHSYIAEGRLDKARQELTIYLNDAEDIIVRTMQGGSPDSSEVTGS
jgi:DNA-binding GntR family transcriptional regulator